MEMRKSAPPRTAPAEIREAIIDCLRSPNRRFLGENPTRAWLDIWGIADVGLYEELAVALESYELFFKPHTNPSKYQFVLRSADLDDKDLLIHITLSPRGKPPRVKINVHPHDIPHPPLPLLPIKQPSHENKPSN